ncbi:MAG: polysaccharide deacetylase [Ruminococcaceae bacterium]|nr:polysaccharide deacetylase [Oscillospiraceae bacterium]
MKESSKKTTAVIVILCILIVLLSGFAGYLYKLNLDSRAAETDLRIKASNEASSYRDEISNAVSEAESYSAAIDENNAVHESEKAELYNRIEDLNRQLLLKLGTNKIIYLTFDDGPSPVTPQILQILDNYGIKATFFVKNNPGYNQYMTEIVNRGNAIALHSSTHNYKKIYSSDEAFYADLQEISDIVYANTGVRSNIMRFPGGSSNTVSRKYNEGIMSRLTKGVTERGYHYFDWNCCSDDATGNTVPVERIVEASKKLPSANTVVVLFHDSSSKTTTVEALPQIIEYYSSLGYSFGVITSSTPQIHHGVNN